MSDADRIQLPALKLPDTPEQSAVRAVMREEMVFAVRHVADTMQAAAIKLGIDPELARLRAQVAELQAGQTALVEKNRLLTMRMWAEIQIDEREKASES